MLGVNVLGYHSSEYNHYLSVAQYGPSTDGTCEVGHM
jgi:hypothetical protein